MDRKALNGPDLWWDWLTLWKLIKFLTKMYIFIDRKGFRSHFCIRLLQHHKIVQSKYRVALSLGSVLRKKAKNDHFHEGEKVGDALIIYKLFSVDFFETKILPFKFGNDIFITFENAKVQRPFCKINVSSFFSPVLEPSLTKWVSRRQPWTMSGRMKYRAAIWSFLKLAPIVFHSAWHSPLHCMQCSAVQACP